MMNTLPMPIYSLLANDQSHRRIVHNDIGSGRILQFITDRTNDRVSSCR